MGDVITDELIESLRTARGGFDRETLRALGVAWPPKSGWKRRLIGQPVPAAVREMLDARLSSLPKPTVAPEDPTTFRLGTVSEPTEPVCYLIVGLSRDAKVTGFRFEAAQADYAPEAAAVAYAVGRKTTGR